jgi:AcrR family transcriptional regulator
MSDALPAGVTIDPSLPPGAQRLLQAAIEILTTEGESALRLTDVAARADVSFGLIAHHFGSRDGLVAVAQRARFAGSVNADLDRVAPLAMIRVTVEQFLNAVRETTRLTIDPERRTVRLGRVAAIGTAHGHPEAAELIGTAAGELLDRMASVLGSFQEQGLIRSDIEVRALATFVQAYALGLVLRDLDPHPALTQDLEHVIMTALDAFTATPKTSSN